MYGHMVATLTMFFYPDSKMCIYLLNMPGVFRNSTMAGYGVYDTMEFFYDNMDTKVVVGVDFNIDTKDYLTKLTKKYLHDPYTF